MKKLFDMTAKVKNDSKLIIMRTVLAVLVLAILAQVLGYQQVSAGLFRGAVIGGLDMVIMFRGVHKALPYVNDPQRGVKVMDRHRYYRLAAAGSILCGMSMMKMPIFFAVGGFLLTHIFYIINLIFVACQLTREGEREERSVKDGK